LYPLVELVTALIVTVLGVRFLPTSNYPAFISYLTFFSALIVGTRTDLTDMVVFRLTTLWIVPIGLLTSWIGFLEITFMESVLGVTLGYGFLWLVSAVFKKIMKKKGMGEGDWEVLALIGSFLGPIGAWMSLLIGSVSGLIISGIYLVATGQSKAKRIPFVPFLALGAALFFLFKSQLLNWIL